MPNAFPPLRANPDLSEADPTALIKIVTHGLSGEIEAPDGTYNVPMAGLGGRLTPEEIAAVLTYVRSNWRNTGGPVTVDQVVAVQNAHPDSRHPWTVPELNRDVPAGAPVVAAAGESSGATRPRAGGAASGVAIAASGDPNAKAAVPTRDPVAWGEVLYNHAAQCASCHQADGAGIAGTYSPLAGSPWVTGETERLIKVALHGVGGEIEVRGETYNAEMPGQGALLDNEQLAATLTYIRQAWGNSATPIYPDHVERVRADHAGRHAVWPASELAKADARSTLVRLRYRRFDLPADLESLAGVDLAALPAASEGEIADGYVDLEPVAGRPAKGDELLMIVVFEADFEVPVEDQYVYTVESSGAVVLELDGERVVGRDKIRGNYNDAGQVLLSPGTHRLRLVSATAGKRRNLKLSAQADSVNRAMHRLSKGATGALLLEDPSYLLVPAHDQPIVLRGRYEGQSKRGVGVGHPLRLNWTFDFQRGQLTHAWRGDFVNAAARWRGRNDRYMKPAGNGVLELGKRPPLARRESPSTAWPSDVGADAASNGYTSLGSSLVEGVPQMFGRFGRIVLRDAPRAVPGADGAAPRLRRTLEAFAAEADADPALFALLADGERIESLGGGVYAVDGAYRIALVDTAGDELREQEGRTLLIAPAAWRAATAGPSAWTADDLNLGPDQPAQRATWELILEWID